MQVTLTDHQAAQMRDMPSDRDAWLWCGKLANDPTAVEIEEALEIWFADWSRHSQKTLAERMRAVIRYIRRM